MNAKPFIVDDGVKYPYSKCNPMHAVRVQSAEKHKPVLTGGSSDHTSKVTAGELHILFLLSKSSDE